MVLSKEPPFYCIAFSAVSDLQSKLTMIVSLLNLQFSHSFRHNNASSSFSTSICLFNLLKSYMLITSLVSEQVWVSSHFKHLEVSSSTKSKCFVISGSAELMRYSCASPSLPSKGACLYSFVFIPSKTKQTFLIW